MKKGKSILTRCLALVLALVLIVSSANLGAALKASAASGKEVSYGKLMADTYELADWEVALLSSGLLDPHFGYCAAPTADDKLVSINEAGKKIVAKNHCTDGSENYWIPVSADIMVDNKSVETIEIVNNEGTYTYAGEEFSVVVTYAMYAEVAASTQDMLLNTGVYLNEALANLETVYGQDSNLMIVEEALGMLMSIKDLSPDGQTQFSADFRAAVEALNAQKTEGGLELRNLIATYAEGTAYMYANWNAYAEATAETYDYLNAIHNDSLLQGGGIDEYLYWNDQIDGTDNLTLWKTFKSTVKDLVEVLDPVAHDAWNVQKNYFVQPGAELDALLKNVGEPTKVNYVEKLLVETATVQATLNMQTVVVSVELKVVEDIPNSTNLVSGGAAKRVILSVKQNATEAEINAAIEKSGVVAQAQAAWGEAYKAEHYEATTAVSEVNGNIVVTITYAPVNYTITYNYQDAKQVPYGYTEVLEYHEDATKAYDYTVNGEPKMAGLAFYITGDTEITRTEGKAYAYTTLYTVIGQNFGNKLAQDILASGAIYGDAAILYRAPETLEEIQGTLVNKELSVVASYESDCLGLKWVPYTYGNETVGFKQFSGNTASGYAARQAQVDYILKLTNVEEAEVAEVLTLVEELYAEATSQMAGMDSLMAQYDDVTKLNKGYLEGLISIIKNFDFTPGDGANGGNNYEDAKNKELIAYFTGIIGKMVAKEGGYIDTTNNNLMIQTILDEYRNGGLAYYYKNSAEIIRQVSDLGSFLNQLIADEEYQAALALLLESQKMPEYIEKISKLGGALESVKENLIPTNEAINTSADMKKLVAALSVKGEVEVASAGVPYITSNKITVVDESAVVLIANIYVDGEQVATVTTSEYDRFSALTGAMNNELLDKIWAKYDELLGEKGDYYSVNNSEWAKLDDLIGTELTENLSVKVYADATQYTVKVEGQDAQTITINDLTVDLPQHKDHPNTVYEYTVKGETTRATSYTFTIEDLDTLFENGIYNISVETLEVGQQMLNAALEALNNNTAGNSFEVVDGTLVADVAASADGIMAFAMGLLDTGYGYIGLNNMPMMYSVEGEGLEISLQTIIDAICQDAKFSRDAVINMGKNGEGEILHATLQLGIDADVLYEEAMPFVLNLTAVPEQMATVAKGLEAGKNHFNFYSNGDHVFVNVNLPEKVYEVYLTAMWGVGELDKTDLNAINNQIALNFLYDYVMLIAESDISAMTFENTLRIFDEAANAVLDKDIPDYDIAAYDKYLQLVKKALTSEGVVVESDEETMSLSVTGQGKHLLTLAEGLGINLDAYRTQLGMIKEFKDGEVLSGKVVASLANTAVDFEALVIDVSAGIAGAKEIKNISNRDEAVDEAIDLIKGMGLANGIDYTTDLPTRIEGIGKSAIMLLDDVDGNLTFNDITILDLNGKTINGNLVANDTVLIIDSTLDTANAGKITGSVSGNVIILAGNYNANVAAYLPDGYLQVNGNVRNALYTVESPNAGDMIVTVNTDFYMSSAVNGYLPNVAAIAGDILVDQMFNYYLTSKLEINGNTIFNIDFDNIVGILDSATPGTDIINQLLTMVDAKGFSAVYNTICEDLLDFAAIEQALLNGTKIYSYDVTVAPYGIEIDHIEDGDYLTINVGSVDSRSWTFEIALKTEGEVNTARAAKFFGDLASIVDADRTYSVIDIEQPYYSDRTLWLDGYTKNSLGLDLSKNPAFQTVIAVFLAYGNPDKAEDLVNAIGDQAALKALFNEISVAEVFNALKQMQLDVNFTEMAASVGVTVDTSEVSEYERVIHLAAVSIGYVLDRLDITGWTDKTMGMIEEGDSGCYSLGFDADCYADATVRGFTVDVAAVIDHVIFSVKIFGDDCLWGDANHDGVVDAMDATLVLQYHVDSLAEGQFFCTKRTDVNGDGEIDAMDATLILQHFVGTITEFPVER